MTALTPGPPGQNIFSMFSGDGHSMYRTKREPFLYSLLGQAAILGLLIYFTSCVIGERPPIIGKLPVLGEMPLIFSGHHGGGGGGLDPLPARRGDLPKPSLDDQVVSPTVMVPKEKPRLAVEATVTVDPGIQLPQGAQVGDPMSQLTRALSDGPGGPNGIGPGCCGGIGPSTGPGVGPGPPGPFPAGTHGVTVPTIVYNPEPSFSEEARKSKTQGVVTLILVVGKDGRPYNIRVGQSLGMGLDEKAIEAVSRWRFRPATFSGQPVATQIAVEVDFHLY
jgi:protein TonB